MESLTRSVFSPNSKAKMQHHYYGSDTHGSVYIRLVSIVGELDRLAQIDSQQAPEIKKCSTMLCEHLLLQGTIASSNIESEFLEHKKMEVLEDLQKQINGLVIIRKFLKSQALENPSNIQLQADILNIQKELKNLSQRHSSLLNSEKTVANKSILSPSYISKRPKVPPPSAETKILHKRRETNATQMKQAAKQRRPTKSANSTPTYITDAPVIRNVPLTSTKKKLQWDEPLEETNLGSALLSKLLCFPEGHGIGFDENIFLEPLDKRLADKLKENIVPTKSTNILSVVNSTVGVLSPAQFKNLVKEPATKQISSSLPELTFSPQAKASCAKEFIGWKDSPAKSLINQFQVKWNESRVEMSSLDAVEDVPVEDLENATDNLSIISVANEHYDARVCVSESEEDSQEPLEFEILDDIIAERSIKNEVVMVREEIITEEIVQKQDLQEIAERICTKVIENALRIAFQRSEDNKIVELIVSEIVENVVENSVRNEADDTLDLTIPNNDCNDTLETILDHPKEDTTWMKDMSMINEHETFFSLDLSIIDKQQDNTCDEEESDAEDEESMTIDNAEVEVTIKSPRMLIRNRLASEEECPPVPDSPLIMSHDISLSPLEVNAERQTNRKPKYGPSLPNHVNLQMSVKMAR